MVVERGKFRKREVQDMLRFCADNRIYPDVIIKTAPLKNVPAKDDPNKGVVIDMRGSFKE